MKVLVFCAHADDEVIGIGGTLRKLANAGARIRLVMFSEGAEGYTKKEEKADIVERRAKETALVCEILGIEEYVNLKMLDWDLKVDNRMYHAVLHNIREFQPDIVFTHAKADYNDHIVVHNVSVEGWFHAALPCAIEEGEPWKLVPVYEFEILQPIINPSMVIDITDTYEAKVEAMNCYASQHDVVSGVFQMMEGRALQRGSLIGVKYGEAIDRSAYRPKSVKDVTTLLDSGTVKS